MSSKPSSPFQVAYGQRVQQARVATQLNQTQLGNRLGLTRSSIANIEAGRQKTYAEMAARIAQVCGVSVQWLITGSDLIPAPAPPLLSRQQLRGIAASLRAVLDDIESVAPVQVRTRTVEPKLAAPFDLLETEEL